MFWFWKKIGNILITLFGVVTIIFFLFNILPGDPAQMMLGQNENSEQLVVLKKKQLLKYFRYQKLFFSLKDTISKRFLSKKWSFSYRYY